MTDKFLGLFPEGYLIGGLANGMIVMPDKRVCFLPYDPMRQFKPKEEIEKEITVLIENAEQQ